MISNERLRDIELRGDYALPIESKEMALTVLVARSIVSEWAEKKGHALCHQHPEILQRVAHALGVPVPAPPLVPEEEMEAACQAYRDFLFRREIDTQRGRVPPSAARW